MRNITVNDLPVGRDVDETLRLVKAFQFTDTNGESKSRFCHVPAKVGQPSRVDDLLMRTVPQYSFSFSLPR